MFYWFVLGEKKPHEHVQRLWRWLTQSNTSSKLIVEIWTTFMTTTDHWRHPQSLLLKLEFPRVDSIDSVIVLRSILAARSKVWKQPTDRIPTFVLANCICVNLSCDFFHITLDGFLRVFSSFLIGYWSVQFYYHLLHDLLLLSHLPRIYNG